MAARKWTHDWKRLENPTLRSDLIAKADKNKIPTAIPMLSVLTVSMAVIITLPKITSIGSVVFTARQLC